MPGIFKKEGGVMHQFILIFCILVTLALPVQAELIDNGDGTQTDTLTGLMFQTRVSLFNRATSDSIIFLYNLSPNYDNWRYPTLNEISEFLKTYYHDVEGCLWYDNPSMAICNEGGNLSSTTADQAYLLMVRTPLCR
jgi:hypothetical protein